MATMVFCWQKNTVTQAFNKMMDVRIWGHHSTKIDISLMLFNSMFRGVLFFVTGLGSLVMTQVVVRGLFDLNPNHSSVGWSYSKTVLVYSVTSFLILDFTRYFQHYLSHKVPLFWRFHKVHHTAEVMTPLTLYRTHPFESFVSSLRRFFVVGVISGFFIYYTQSAIDAYAILGVHAFDFVFNFFGSNLRHSHVWLSFGSLNHIFMSPAQHQVHHSRALKHRDKNLGFALSLWDKLFGTFYQVRDKELLIFGVRGERYRNILCALKAPFFK